MSSEAKIETQDLTPEARALLEKLEPGDVILVSSRWVRKPSDISSCAIRLANFTRKGPSKRYWTHSAMYLGENRVIEAFPAPIGIVIRDIRQQYLSSPDYKLKAIRLKNRTKEKRSKAADKCLKLGEGKSYDFIALLYFVLSYVTPAYFSFILEDNLMGKWFNTVEKYFCSELVADSCLQADVYCFDREPYQIMPAHFDNDLVFGEVGHLEIKKPGWILRLPEWLKRAGYYIMLLAWVLLPIILIGGALVALGWRMNAAVSKKSKEDIPKSI